jgi:hypothetical protein
MREPLRIEEETNQPLGVVSCELPPSCVFEEIRRTVTVPASIRPPLKKLGCFRRKSNSVFNALNCAR